MTIRERLRIEFISAVGISPDYRLNRKFVKGLEEDSGAWNEWITSSHSLQISFSKLLTHSHHSHRIPLNMNSAHVSMTMTTTTSRLPVRNWCLE